MNADRILEIGSAFKGAKVLLSGVELGVFTALGKKPLQAETLRREIGIAKRGAEDSSVAWFGNPLDELAARMKRISEPLR